MYHYNNDIYSVRPYAHNLMLHNPPLHRRCVACLDTVHVSDEPFHQEERIVSSVQHLLVSQPDVAHNDVNGRLVESMAIRELFVVVFLKFA